MVRVLKQYFTIRGALFFIAEGALIFLSLLLAIAIRFSFEKREMLNFDLLFFKALVFTAICQVCLSFCDLYSFKNGCYKKELFKKLVQSIGSAAIVLSIVSYLFPSVLIGRGIFAISLIICPFFLVFWRQFYSLILDKSLLNERVIIIGSGALAKEIGSEILSNKSLGYQIVGFIDEDPNKVGMRVLNPSIIGDYNQLFRIARNEKIDQIIVALTERRGTLPVNELLKCKMLGVEVEDGLSFYERMTGKVSLEELKPSWLIYSDGFRIQKSKRIIKRIMDVIISLTGFLLTAPFLLIIPVLIRLDSRGPVFYRQERIGENGGIFTLLKFRSMKAGAEAKVGPVWAQDNDPRITRIGQFMRKTRIDEIPQLINVLKGEMSFVGPRPERPCFVEKLTQEIPYYPLRCSIKPGITGWAQIKYSYGSSVKDAAEKLTYDLYYIKNLSVFLDVAILFSTVKVVLSTRGAR